MIDCAARHLEMRTPIPPSTVPGGRVRTPMQDSIGRKSRRLIPRMVLGGSLRELSHPNTPSYLQTLGGVSVLITSQMSAQQVRSILACGPSAELTGLWMGYQDRLHSRLTFSRDGNAQPYSLPVSEKMAGSESKSIATFAARLPRNG